MKLKEIRVLRGIKQDDLAEMLGVEKSIVCKYESGSRPVPTKRLKDLAEALDVSVNTLTSDGDLLLKKDGTIVSYNDLSFSNEGLDEIDASVLKEILELLNSNDLKWQKRALRTLKLQNVLTEEILEKISAICATLVWLGAGMSVGLSIAMVIVESAV